MTDRLTAAELAAAADALTAQADPLPPMPVAEVLDHLAYELRDRLADLWTLRDAIDTDLTGARHAAAVAAVATMSEHYADALDTARRLAADLDHWLPIDCAGPPW